MANNWIFLSASLTLISISCSSAPSNARAIEYYSSNRGTVLILAGDTGYLGPNPAAPRTVGKMVVSMKLLTPLAKPAMVGGSCVAYENFTFAVEKVTRAGASYECNGVGFHVTRCDKSSVQCGSFEVEARCFNFRDGKCRPNGDTANLTLTYVFGYNIKKGLLWVDFAPGNLKSDVLKLAGEQGYRLP
jgi:hypothetical protein